MAGANNPRRLLMIASEMIASVLRILSVLSDADAPTAEQVAQHIEDMNDMMAEWEAYGITLGYQPVQSGTDDITVQDWAVRAVKYNLALQLAPQYSDANLAVIGAMAEASKKLVTKKCVLTVIDSVYDVDTVNVGIPYTRFWF